MYKILEKKRSNSRRFEKVMVTFADDQIDLIKPFCEKRGWKYNGTPYIFTHIDLIDKDNKPLIITQNHDQFGVIMSPEALNNLLK